MIGNLPFFRNVVETLLPADNFILDCKIKCEAIEIAGIQKVVLLLLIIVWISYRV